MNPEKLKKLQAMSEKVRIGGKGRRKSYNIAEIPLKFTLNEINIFLMEEEALKYLKALLECQLKINF